MKKALIALFVLLGGYTWAAETTAAQGPEAKKPTEAEVETWRQKIIATPQPKVGCFTASYPDTAWREVPCKTKSARVLWPKQPGGIRPANTGNGDDFMATTTANVREVEGSFDSVSVTSETQNDTSTPPVAHPNVYGLQLNTEFFTTTTCGTSPAPASCRGWQQFLFDSGGDAFIQYWMLNYGPAGTLCPAPRHTGPGCSSGFTFSDGWCEEPGGATMSCVRNSVGGPGLPTGTVTPLDITQIHQVKLRGRTPGVAGSTTDAIFVTYGTTVSSTAGWNVFPDLDTQWHFSEFNLFGSCCLLRADVNPGATFVVRVSVTDGTMNPPGCVSGGTTGETTNMTIVDTTGPVMHTGVPSLIFTETNNGLTSVPMCSQAVSVGDTHITTFDGVYYDFQASGEFLVAEDGPDFVVQARQASGAPSWPNAAVNKAVAVKMGATRIVISIEPTRVEIDGTPASVADGANIQRPTGVQLTRRGNVYWISDERGYSVRTTLNPTWIDVKVGLGQAPHTAVRGLLGNPNGNGRDLVTREKVVLKAPVLFQDLYNTFGESWRVSAKDSLFHAETRIKPGNPTKPFYSRDLPKEKAAKAAAACKAAGVSDPVFLDSCILDTTVLGDKTATKVFTNIVPPKSVIKPVPRQRAQ